VRTWLRGWGELLLPSRPLCATTIVQFWMWACEHLSLRTGHEEAQSGETQGWSRAERRRQTPARKTYWGTGTIGLSLPQPAASPSRGSVIFLSSLALAVLEPGLFEWRGPTVLVVSRGAVLSVKWSPSLLLSRIAAVTAHELVRGVHPQTAMQRCLIEVDEGGERRVRPLTRR
jgi:hypothetical protein